MTQIIRQRPRDCLSCRLISGLGLVGAGFYVAYNGKRAKYRTGRFVYFSIATALAGLGAARLFDLPPFRNDEMEKEEL